MSQMTRYRAKIWELNDENMVALRAAALTIANYAGSNSLSMYRRLCGPIRAAAKSGKFDLIARVGRYSELIPLLDVADLESNQTIYHHAARYNRVDIIDACIQAGGRAYNMPDKNGSTPLHIAVRKEHVEILATLLRISDCAIVMADNNGFTPMHEAAWKGRVDIMHMLLQAGGRGYNMQDKNGSTPLRVAVRKERVEIIAILLKISDCAIDMADNNGFTPMHGAAWKGRVDIMHMLLQAGSKSIDAVATGFSGYTPLHIATQNKDESMIRSLIQAGSQAMDIMDSRGLVPLIFALEWGITSLIESLIIPSRILDPSSMQSVCALKFLVQRKSHSCISTFERLLHLWNQSHSASRITNFVPCSKSRGIYHYVLSPEVVYMLLQWGYPGADWIDHRGRSPIETSRSNKIRDIFAAIEGDLNLEEDIRAQMRVRAYFQVPLLTRLLREIVM